MAGYTKTITLGLDYSNFSGGIKDCNSKLKMLDAEFNNINSTMGENMTIEEKVALKANYLSERVAIQSQKVEECRSKYEALVNAHADTSKIQAAATALMNEESTLKNMTTELEMAGLKQNQLKAILAASIGTIVAIGAAFANATVKAAEYADEVNTMSQQSGASTEMVQTWKYMEDQVDVSAEAMVSAMSKLKKNMNDASSGTGSAASAFRQLGISVTTSSGELKSADTVMYEVFDALKGMKNETEKDAIAMTLLGRSADSLAGAIDGGSDAYEEFNSKASEAGAIMSSGQIDSLNSLQDAFDQLKQKGQAVSNTIGSVFAPVLSALASILNAIPTPVLAVVTVVGALAAAFVAGTVALVAFKAILPMLAASAISTSAAFAPLVVEILAIAGPVLLAVAAISALVLIIASLVDAVQNAGGLGSVFSNMASGIKQALNPMNILLNVAKTVINTFLAIRDAFNAMTSAINSFAEAISNLTGASSSAIGNAVSNIGHNAEGTQSWRGGLTWVGEQGPELVNLPQGSQVYSSTDSQGMSVGGATYNISMNCDLSKMKSVSDVVSAVQGIAVSAGCGGVL